MNGALMLWITFLTLWMTCGVTGAPTKYLFTAPRNLWQGSREEFCISFHDDKDIQANYLVTLSLTDESDVLLGNGTTNEDGRVCHHFTVPDLSGRHKLTLQTETIRVLETGVSTTVTRVDTTEVEIHESALETFIQTDKPIYKPGETVKFRAMTINKDLKPWTGMLPLVTVKNPGDVRLMQWLNVENNKGLLSFEMPLSEDPPLGEWKITMLVEGKEHVQPFTVQEYVLPKYEVTITAPTFLLPTTETIQGTVCAKYTYGKPVKGKVELSVCFQDTSPYFYYYRSRDNSERPCATRIMDIDGCETYMVDGSELMLDSSNFSRYGNLMINATVTEQATAISLNGTVKGPEMTFEAVKLKFEDDTHGYFKDAFPYYARVKVTKPDGSPAPGELIEIKADNYDPEFYLKRNFTSDDDGLVKFAIKTLPKDVNRLSFNARAPKYFQPYGRYHHIIKMYEPSSYHHAQKWFSPSNSYIHIPSVENKVKCGSTLDLDVLYSTPLDTRYKFFVQVLSKSHMVHHTHVTHYFKSHDAVNFDSLPDEMLLDPYTPPPRPTWLYPIDPIPYYEVDCFNRYNKGINYAGHVSKIPSSLTCLKWSEVNIHPLHNYTEDHNYCRNPMPSGVDSPFCYTTKEFAFEKCVIPVCDCRNSTNDFDYSGNISITRRGHNCSNNQYCRAPSNDPESARGPWCFTGLGNQQWGYCNVPVCESATCPDLSGNPNLKPLDGKTTYRYGEIVMLTCNTGYKLNGSKSLTCQQSGQWNNAIPHCQVVTCHDLRQVPHQKMEPVQIAYSYRDNVTFECDDGYELSPADTMVTCQNDGTWSNKQPNCTGLLCPPLSKIDNALLPTKIQGYRYPETLKVFCETGYAVEGSSLLHCNSSGLWGFIPQCKENSQSHKDSMENRGKCISYGLFGGMLAAIVLISTGLQIATCFYYRKRVRKSAAVYEDMQFNAVGRQRSSNDETYSELT
ncbi:Hypothetical predicted protein [Mytilus galloprovincialis]|uniref:Uncharacterized protein n=1 Tax=Mytilus galloprovincialis TaxID=29158 RepID=A0A8B6BN88_MYTGA|nr:Hypothetical predicted protein [Mytilus galloprovincialis]